ncbi:MULTISPECIES: hypothetical protein [unclassified Streptomyces]|nr:MULTISPECIES: hypothetical protein [unclassified Streptomyces]
MPRAEAAVDGWYALLTSAPAHQVDAGHDLIQVTCPAHRSSA